MSRLSFRMCGLMKESADLCLFILLLLGGVVDGSSRMRVRMLNLRANAFQFSFRMLEIIVFEWF